MRASVLSTEQSRPHVPENFSARRTKREKLSLTLTSASPIDEDISGGALKDERFGI